MAVDGDRRAQLLMGVPLLMEYDGPTGAWKLVIDTELDTVIMVSGTVSIEASDLEIGAVEIKDGLTDQRATVDALNQLHTFITGSYVEADTELPTALPLADNMANPTAPQVAAHLMGYDGAGSDWERARMDGPNLLVSLVSGSFPTGETLPVSLTSLPNLVVTEDEVTAYVTGTVSTEPVARKETYRVVFNGLTNPIGTAVAIIGAANRTIKVTQVQIVKPSVAQAPLRIRKYSTAITSGTFSTPTPVPLDSNNAAASGVVNLYTDVPTDGTLVGALFDADVGIGDIIYETFGEQQNAQPVALRGISEYLSVETAATGTFAGYVEWTEE